MSAAAVAFSVYGDVRTNERARHGKGFTYTPAATQAARREIVQAFRERSAELPHAGPVRLSVTIQHATSAEKRWEGRFCKRKPDLDNVVKLVADALNGVAYFDDAQIVEMRATKSYGETSALHVELQFEDEVPKPLDGRVRCPDREGAWQIWDSGTHLGDTVRVGSRHQAVCPAAGGTIGCPGAASGNWRTVGEAEAAVREAFARVENSATP